MTDYKPVTANDIRTNFRLFAAFMFATTRRRQLIPAPHHAEICSALERVIAGKCKRLIISVSPRSGKTLLVSQMFPAYGMGLNPASSFILTSYSHSLASDNTYAIREIMRDEVYQGLWPTRPILAEDAAARDNFRTVHGGMVYGVGSGGTIVGKGAGGMGEIFSGAIIIDDIAKPDEAYSDTMRANVIRWFSSTLESRKNSPNTPIIVIGQRLHEEDLPGWLLNGGNGEEWELVKIPAIDESGASFWPEQFPLETLERMRDANPYTFAAQYQQTPVPFGGGMFRTDKIDKLDSIPDSLIVARCRYWDKAGTAGGTGARTAGILMGRLSDGRTAILDSVTGRWEAGERERVIRRTAERDGRSVPIGVEQEPGSGGKESAEYTARNLAGWNVRLDRPVGDKVTRAEPFAAQVDAGSVVALNRPWTQEYLHELAHFPRGKLRDQVDASSGAFAIINRPTSGFALVR